MVSPLLESSIEDFRIYVQSTLSFSYQSDILSNNNVQPREGPQQGVNFELSKLQEAPLYSVLSQHVEVARESILIMP